MKKSNSRTPKYYDGTQSTNHIFSALLQQQLTKIRRLTGQRPDLVVAAWSEIIGPKMAPHAKAISLSSGVLTVLVQNATLYSLLRQYEHPRLLRKLQQRFPRSHIEAIRFRMGK